MFRIHFTEADLLRTRMAREPDPMWETVLSLHALQARNGSRILDPWRRYAVGAVPQDRARRLMELAPPTGYFPDFLTPAGHDLTLEEKLDRVSATSRSELSEQIELLAQPGPFRGGIRVSSWLHGLSEGARTAMRDLADFVRDYNEAGLRPFWGTIRAEIAADRAKRVEHFAAGGLDALLAGLHPRVRWNPPCLEVEGVHTADLHLEGRGLLLQPSYFCDLAPTKLREPGEQPVLIYPVRRDAVLAASTSGPDAAGVLLGGTRAAILKATADGCTTSDLARSCGVALSTVSQHASVLRESGLIRTRRVGGSVLHQITDLGSRLLHGAAGLTVPRPRNPFDPGRKG